MSQSKRYEVLTVRYRDVEAEEKQETPWVQQEAYEAEQIKKAITTVGARDRRGKAGGHGVCMGKGGGYWNGKGKEWSGRKGRWS